MYPEISAAHLHLLFVLVLGLVVLSLSHEPGLLHHGPRFGRQPRQSIVIIGSSGYSAPVAFSRQEFGLLLVLSLLRPGSSALDSPPFRAPPSARSSACCLASRRRAAASRASRRSHFCRSSSLRFRSICSTTQSGSSERFSGVNTAPSACCFFHCRSHVRAPHISDSDFPVPVGLSKMPTCPPPVSPDVVNCPHKLHLHIVRRIGMVKLARHGRRQGGWPGRAFFAVRISSATCVLVRRRHGMQIFADEASGSESINASRRVDYDALSRVLYVVLSKHKKDLSSREKICHHQFSTQVLVHSDVFCTAPNACIP